MNKISSKILAILIAGVALLAFSCASADVKTNPAATFPLEVNAENPAFVFPISLHFSTSGVDKDVVGLAIAAGVVAEFETSVIGGQPLYDLVGNLSWTLGENIRRQANNDTWEMTGSAKAVTDELSGIMGAIGNALAELGLIEQGFNFKYIIVLHADSAGGLPIPETTSFFAFGGIYEVETNSILSYIETKVTIADSQPTILAQVPMAFNKIIKQLIAGSVDVE